MWYTLPLFLFFALIQAEEPRYRVSSCGDLPLYNLYNTAIAYDNRDSIFIMGGEDMNFDDYIFTFNIQNSTIKHAGRFLKSVGNGDSATDPNGNIFYFGGSEWSFWRPNKEVYRIDTTVKPEPVAVDQEFIVKRYRPGVVTIGDTIYAFGGDLCDDDAGKICEVTTVEAYNMSSQTSRIVATIPSTSTRLYATSAVYDGSYAYVFGGKTGRIWTADDRILRFDPITNNIKTLDAKLPFPIESSGAAMGPNGIAYIMPGFNFDHYENSCSLVAFNTKDHTSSVVDVAPFGHFDRANLVYVPKKNKLYSASASSETGHYRALMCVDLPFECSGRDNGDYANTRDCTKYFTCSNELKYKRDCPEGLHFNAATHQCDYPESANCEV